MIDHGDETETLTITLSVGLIDCIEDMAERNAVECTFDEMVEALLTNALIDRGTLRCVGGNAFEYGNHITQ